MWFAALHQSDRQTEIWRAAGKGHQPDHPPSEQIPGLQVRQPDEIQNLGMKKYQLHLFFFFFLNFSSLSVVDECTQKISLLEKIAHEDIIILGKHDLT